MLVAALVTALSLVAAGAFAWYLGMLDIRHFRDTVPRLSSNGTGAVLAYLPSALFQIWGWN